MVDNNNDNRSLFVGPPPPIRPGISRTSNANQNSLIRATSPNPNNKQGAKMIDNIMKAKAGYDSLPPGVKEAIKTGANNVFVNIKGRGGSSSSHSSGYSLSKAPNPRQTSLDTGVKPNTYTSEFMEPIEDKCSPLHMTGVKFQFPNYAESHLYDYFMNVITFDLQTKAQVNVGFNLNINTDFSSAKILKAMNDLVYAIQIYFYYMSIISYHSDPVNKNMGMISLRNQFTPTLIEDLSLLGRRLADTPCPPKLLEFLRYLSGNFYSGETQGSSLIKFYPLTPSETLIDSSLPLTALNALASSDNNGVYSLMRRAIPQWSPKILYDVEPIPAYDANFKTLFANAPFGYYANATYSYAPLVASSDQVIPYNTFTNSLDGAIYAMTSMYNSVNSKWLPGLLVPTAVAATSQGNSRMSYYKISGVSKFYPSDSNQFLSRCRAETYKINDAATALLGLHVFGADKCQGVSSDTVRETTFEVVDYLMSLESVKIDVRKHHFSSDSSGTTGNSRRRRK